MGPGRVRPWDLSWSRTCREVGWRAEAQMRGSSEKRSRGRQQVGTDRRDLFWSEWARRALGQCHLVPLFQSLPAEVSELAGGPSLSSKS